MTKTKLTWARIGAVSTLVSMATTIGPGISAVIRGNSVTESASVAGFGAGFIMVAIGTADRFGFFSENKSKADNHRLKMIESAALLLMGTAVGYAGLKIFINAAASIDPIIDAVLGSPITIGIMYCCKLLMDSHERNQHHYLHIHRNKK